MSLKPNPNFFGGEFAREVNTALALGSNDVQSQQSGGSGLFRIVSAKGKYVNVRLMNTTGTALQQGTLCDSTATQTRTMADKRITLESYNIFETYCKNDLVDSEYALQMERGALNTEIPMEVLEALTRSLAGQEVFNLERIRWSGDITSADPVLQLQDGLIKKIKAAGTGAGGYIRVTPTTATASQSATTVIAEINKVLAAVPAVIRRQAGFKLILSPEVAAAYEQAISAQGAMSPVAVTVNPLQNNVNFLGFYSVGRIPMYVVNGLGGANKEVILACVASEDASSNLIFATDALSDMNSITVVDRQTYNATQPFVDIAWVMNHGVDFGRASEIVLYHN